MSLVRIYHIFSSHIFGSPLWVCPWWWRSCGVGTRAGCCYDGVWPRCSTPTSSSTGPATCQVSRYVSPVIKKTANALYKLPTPSSLPPAPTPHLNSLPPTQEALGRRSVGGSVAALLKPLFTDLEPATRQLTAIGRATLAQLDTVPGVGEKVRSTLRLLGFLEEGEREDAEGEGSAGGK